MRIPQKYQLKDTGGRRLQQSAWPKVDAYLQLQDRTEYIDLHWSDEAQITMMCHEMVKTFKYTEFTWTIVCI